MTNESRKEARKAAVEREIRKREDALGVPSEAEVYVFQKHYCDEGGPRPMSVKQFEDRPNDFDFVQWKERLARAADKWEPVEIVPDNDPELPPDLPVGDYAEFNGLMIFSTRAANALEHLLRPCGLLLPVMCSVGEYLGFRLDAKRDALDLGKTRASWWPKKEVASSIYTYAFHTERLGEAGIFRVPQHFEILVNREFVQVVRSHAFTGFRFCRVWPTAMATLWWYENWC